MAKYIALIYLTPEDNTAGIDTPEARQMHQQYGAFTEAAMKAGVTRGGEALMPVSTATTVRTRDGKQLTTDGPFAETKEQLCGYYLFECKDLDEAIQWAAKIPAAERGSIELRPIAQM